MKRSMSSLRHPAGLVAAAIAILVTVLMGPLGWTRGDDRAPARDVTAEPLRFDASVSPGDRAAVLAAIAAARPEARELVERVDGLVTVVVGATGSTAVGLTAGSPSSGYTVTLDLAAVRRGAGERGVRRLVLHEMGHVVDHALLTPQQQRALDAGIPTGYACREGEPTGACATREERFAETFAKWATNDIGINVSLGYKVPPPPSLDAWGAGLPARG